MKRRVVALTCSNTEIVCALGCAEMLVAVDDHSDFPAEVVRALLDAAFGGETESKVVERLRADGDFILSLVAENREGVAGYASFPRLVLRLDERNVPVAGLAPVGVSPPLQRRGIGRPLQ